MRRFPLGREIDEEGGLTATVCIYNFLYMMHNDGTHLIHDVGASTVPATSKSFGNSSLLSLRDRFFVLRLLRFFAAVFGCLALDEAHNLCRQDLLLHVFLVPIVPLSITISQLFPNTKRNAARGVYCFAYLVLLTLITSSHSFPVR